MLSVVVILALLALLFTVCSIIPAVSHYPLLQLAVLLLCIIALIGGYGYVTH